MFSCECLPVPLGCPFIRPLRDPWRARGLPTHPGFSCYLFLMSLPGARRSRGQMHAPQEAQEHLDQGRPPECCGRSSTTDLKDSEPGFQEQKDQQLKGTRCQEDPDLCLLLQPGYSHHPAKISGNPHHYTPEATVTETPGGCSRLGPVWASGYQPPPSLAG